MIYVSSAKFINCQIVDDYIAQYAFQTWEDAMTMSVIFFSPSGFLGFFHPKGTNTFAKSMKISSWIDSI